MNRNTDKDDRIYNYSNIRNKLKTGDLILFTCKKHGSLFANLMYLSRTTLLGSDYGHAGIVIKDKRNNHLYIAECCGHDQCGNKYANYLNKDQKGGIRIIDLDILLKEYHNEYNGSYAVKFISNEIPNSIIISALKKYKNVRFQERHILCMLAAMDIFISHPVAAALSNICDKNKMICTEFVHDLLHECNVLDKYPSKLFWPHLITNHVFKKLEKIKYSRPFKFSIVQNNNNNQNNDNNQY